MKIPDIKFSKKIPKIGHGGLLLACLLMFLAIFTSFSSIKMEAKNGSAIIELEDMDELIISEISAEQNDSALARAIEIYLERYRPPNAFILVMDANSGSVLAWGQRENDENSKEPTFFKRDSFPAASLAKIATAVAALENGKSAKSEFPKIGRNSTLYKRQIFPEKGYAGDMISLEDAFAKSNNPVMGIIGIELGKDKMQSAAEKLGFANFYYPDSAYEIAESSSGFTRRNMLSPLQAALAVRKLLFTKPEKDFQGKTYSEIRELFLRTVTEGTARKHIGKSVYSYNRKNLDIGGKTGSLDGNSPTGRYDWFAGFAQLKSDPEKAIIIVIMQVHGEMRNQYSSVIAGLLINEWAKKF
jgi:cell division protein FtsI/penicillin-binding protein 2